MDKLVCIIQCQRHWLYACLVTNLGVDAKHLALSWKFESRQLCTINSILTLSTTIKLLTYNVKTTRVSETATWSRLLEGLDMSSTINFAHEMLDDYSGTIVCLNGGDDEI